MNWMLEVWSAFLVIALLISAFRWPLTYIQLLVISLVGLSLNINLSMDSIDTFVAIHILTSTTAFLIGLVFFGVQSSSLNVRSMRVSSQLLRTMSVVSALVVAMLIVSYHYSVVGVPLFSENIGVERFQQAASGLFGIPSRFATYGPALMFLFILTMLDSGLVRGWLASILIAGCAVLFVLQGHKSSLLQLPLLAVVCYSVLGGTTRRYLLRYATLIAGVGMYLVYEVFVRIGGFDNLAFFEYLVERLSSIGMAPVYAMYSESFQPIALVDLYFINDAIYPFSKALGGGLETVNTQLSRYIYGVEDGQFSVPVTPGIFPYLYSDFGFAGSLLSAVLLSWVSVGLIRKACLSRNVSNRVFYLWLQYTLYVGFSSGNLFYLLPNALMTFLIFWIMERFFNFVFKSMSKSREVLTLSKEVKIV